jgi:hypothetical protein
MQVPGQRSAPVTPAAGRQAAPLRQGESCGE